MTSPPMTAGARTTRRPPWSTRSCTTEAKRMKRLILNAAGLLVLMSALLGLLYPLAATGLAQLLFPAQANGSLVGKDGKPVGSRLIGQSFTEPKYFWGRPSATSPMANNGASSTPSNQGPTNHALTDAAKHNIDALRAADPG